MFANSYSTDFTLGKYTYLHDTQDLVYSMGLVDYFSDKLVIKIINSFTSQTNGSEYGLPKTYLISELDGQIPRDRVITAIMFLLKTKTYL